MRSVMNRQLVHHMAKTALVACEYRVRETRRRATAGTRSRYVLVTAVNRTYPRLQKMLNHTSGDMVDDGGKERRGKEERQGIHERRSRGGGG
jgi:hypothetical protein